MKQLFYLFVIMIVCTSLMSASQNDNVKQSNPDTKIGERLLPVSSTNLPGVQTSTSVKSYSGGYFISTENLEDTKDDITLPAIKQSHCPTTVDDLSGWNLRDTVHVHCYLPAGQNVGVKLNLHNCVFDKVYPFTLSNEAVAAVAKAPKWLRATLEYTLSKITAKDRQIELANVINNAKDPYIDEIAYAIAYSTPQFLSSQYCYPQLFLENAQLIYQHDTDLKYVEIVDHGSSTTDENYYSTTKYWKVDTNGNKFQYEIPMEDYYKYIVHPKGTDEVQTYVNSKVPEYDYINDQSSTHYDNIVAPPSGRFWRDFIYNYTEPIPDSVNVDFPILKDTITKAEVLWDPLNKTPQALKTITYWIKSVMKFTSKDERPHQPDRIYELHIGRCGEHEDITLAAARACLIPCRGIEAMSSDHVWNEFEDESNWQQWEPVNDSYYDKLCYSSGWGKRFGTIFCHQSTGVLYPVTDLYTDKKSCKISLTLVDKNNSPIDGATIYLYVWGVVDSTNIYTDIYNVTDNHGKCNFIVEAGHKYYYKVMSSIGNYPVEDGYVNMLYSNTTAGKNYVKTLQLSSASMPKIAYNTITANDSLSSNYRIDVTYNAQKQVVNWLNLWDDLDNSYTTFEKDTAEVNLFFTDENNYNLCTAGKTFSAFNPQEDYSSGGESFYTPSNETWKSWYAFLNNSNNLSNPVLVDATFKIYVKDNTGIKETNILHPTQILSNYPNPAVEKTQISFNLAQAALAQLNIINVNGVVVRHLINSQLEAKPYSYEWDLKDDNGDIVAPGVYIYTLFDGKQLFANKLVVLR